MTAEQKIDLTPLFQELERPLALVDSPERRADIERYLGAARVHLERGAFDLLSEVVARINDANAGVTARLNYDGGSLSLAVEPNTEQKADEEADPQDFFSVEGDLDKVTIRLPRELKELIDKAATMHGVSANTWYIRELGRDVSRYFRELKREGRRGGRGRWHGPPPPGFPFGRGRGRGPIDFADPAD